MAVRTQAPKKSRQFNLVRPVFQGFFDLHQQNGQTLYSTPEHFGGSFKSSRLFGGHTAAQSFVAAKRLVNSTYFQINLIIIYSDFDPIKSLFELMSIFLLPAHLITISFINKEMTFQIFFQLTFIKIPF
jgi:hypothetical protein